MPTARFCEQCGTTVAAAARFCPNCGFSFTGAAPATAGGGAVPARSGPRAVLPWLLPTVALVAVLGYVIATRGSGTPMVAEAAPGTGISMPASDISTLTPDERVDRLFNRVMSLASAGKNDSVAFFAPMAVNSFAALEPLSLHRRYDLGLVLLVSGEQAGARAQADTILTTAPKHLLGLALAMRAAKAAGNTAEAQRFGTKFKDALAPERARGLAEYRDHASDIDDALAEAEGRPTSAAFARKP